MKTILVTGASGFLGKHLIQKLLESDPSVRVRTFSRSPFPSHDNERIESCTGDVTRVDDVLTACDGVEEIYHLAGIVERTPTNNWTAYDTHVAGTRNVCDAMLQLGTRRCVMVSTSGTIAVSSEPVVHTEDSSYKQTVVKDWPYYLSKIYQEKQALWYCKHKNLPLVIVNPSLLLGPGDDRFSSTNDVRLFLEKQIKVIPGGGLNLVDVRDVATGMISAMRKGSVGERYLLAGKNLTFREWIMLTARIAGMPPPRIQLPENIALAGAALLRRLYSLAGKKYEIDNASIRMSSMFWYCDASKARCELNFDTRPAEETLRDTIQYLQKMWVGA